MPRFQRGRGGEETAEQVKAFPTIRFFKNSYIPNHFVWNKGRKKKVFHGKSKIMFKKVTDLSCKLNKLGENVRLSAELSGCGKHSQ